MSTAECSVVMVLNGQGDAFIVGVYGSAEDAERVADNAVGKSVKDVVDYADSFMFGTVDEAFVRTEPVK